MSTKDERLYIRAKLINELNQAFSDWAKEYQQERDLGKLGEFANLYRKARKLKTLIWDDMGPKNPEDGWREDERTIVIEVIAHGMLMLIDIDKESGFFQNWIKEYYEETEREFEDEEELTSQGKKANRITRKENADAERRQRDRIRAELFRKRGEQKDITILDPHHPMPGKE